MSAKGELGEWDVDIVAESEEAWPGLAGRSGGKIQFLPGDMKSLHLSASRFIEDVSVQDYKDVPMICFGGIPNLRVRRAPVWFESVLVGPENLASRMAFAATEIAAIVAVSRDVAGGRPVLAGTRFPVAQVFAELAEGLTADQIGENFEISSEMVRALLRQMAVYLSNRANFSK